MAKTIISTKVDEESDLYSGFKEYQSEREMTKSEAARALFRAGLSAERTTPTPPVFLYLTAALIGLEVGWRVFAPLLSLPDGLAGMVAVVVAVLASELGRRWYPRFEASAGVTADG